MEHQKVPEKDYIPKLTIRQKREFIGLLARAIFPRTLAGIITWYANGAVTHVPAMFDEIQIMADERGLTIVRHPDDDHLMVAKKKIESEEE